jgi:hypothetical protein
MFTYDSSVNEVCELCPDAIEAGDKVVETMPHHEDGGMLAHVICKAVQEKVAQIREAYALVLPHEALDWDIDEDSCPACEEPDRYDDHLCGRYDVRCDGCEAWKPANALILRPEDDKLLCWKCNLKMVERLMQEEEAVRDI